MEGQENHNQPNMSSEMRQMAAQFESLVQVDSSSGDHGGSHFDSGFDTTVDTSADSLPTFDSIQSADQLDTNSRDNQVGGSGAVHDSELHRASQPARDSSLVDMRGSFPDQTSSGDKSQEDTQLANFLQDEPSTELTNSPEVIQRDLERDQKPSPQGVRYGKPSDLIACAKSLDKRNTSGQDGVLLDQNKFHINQDSYREDKEYDKLGLLGEGSYGNVNIIRDKMTKMDAVAKCVELENFAPSEAENWCNLTTVNSPFIVPLLGLVRNEMTVMLFSEYTPGLRDLEAIIEYFRKEPRQVMVLTMELFRALVCLHENKIVHKDIHENNILVSQSLDHIFLKMKVIDFGESKKFEDIQDDVDEHYDVWCAIHIFIRMLGGHPSSLDYERRISQEVRLPPKTDERILKFSHWVINSRPKAEEVLSSMEELESELYSVPVTGPPGGNYEPSVNVNGV
ncbi:mitogen-activated protein kinase kinase kinase 1-like isoform X2 [Acanthaster planci]|uniref:Mitogen-activated protein kinase kinase kinase 1-like isoform X2 n=1 Tax=Acanthaster planci TaxID=133434 RepID=A0A8B8A1R4_ACAPL|nr:mitogen-activated protein kinase kinase kinase 1-like isoform X2 [Acanthaster planci]